MNFPCASLEWYATKTRWMVLAGALLLAGCHSTPTKLPQLTGNQGGLLPGMNTPPSADKPPTSSTPPGYTGLITQVQPDGHIFVRELINGQRVSETWKSSLGLAERAVYYINDNVVGGTAEFGPDEKFTKRTYFYPGTTQLQQVDEYSDGIHVAKSTTYWPNGNLRMISETDALTPAGRVNRVQEWYQNGEPKSLVQFHVERDDQGQILAQEKQGRQTSWDEAGYPILDQEFDHGRLAHDYLKKNKTVSP